MGGVMVPPCWLFGLRHPSNGAYMVVGLGSGHCVKMAAFKRAHTKEYSSVPSPPVSLTSQWATATHHIPRRHPPTPAGRSDSGSLRNRISVSYDLLALLCISPGGFQSQRVLGVVFPVQDPPGTQRGAQASCSLGRNCAIVIIFLFVVYLPKGMDLHYIASLFLLPISLWFLLYIFSCRKSFLLVFSFSHI